MPRTMPIVTLSEMSPGQEADLFLLMTAKEELKTKTGKPYFRVGFRDGGREVSFPIWGDSPWAVDCRDRWTPGVFYKLRAVYQETNFGPQLEIRKIREVVEADAADGFDPTLCLPRSRFDPQQMFDELLAIARQQIGNAALRQLVESLLDGQPRGAADASGRAAEPSRLRRRAAGAHAERHPHVRLPGRQVRRVLSRDEAAVGQGPGGRRRDPARHRQAPRDGAAAGRAPRTRPKAR